MRLQKKALYLLLAATFMFLWLAMKWYSEPLVRTVYYRSPEDGAVLQRKGSAYSEEFVNEKIDVHASQNQPFYKDHDPEKPMYATLTDDHKDYFIPSGETRCLIEGTANASRGCECKKGWHGPACSYPDILDETKFKSLEKLRVRDGAPRRIIYGLTFNVEFEMLEIRLKEAGDLIDLIIVLESNYTGFGKRKELYLLDKMKKGFMQEYQNKIVYLYLNYFPTGPDPKDGAYIDFYMKSYPSKEGLRRINGTRKDDIFIFADADEVHRREALLFLKLHDGYPEPVGVYMRRNVFGYFWCSGESLLGIGCSLDMLESVYKNRCGEIRGATSQMHKFMSELKEYEQKGNNVQMWQSLIL